MKYYVQEVASIPRNQRTADSKARRDVENILAAEGAEVLRIPSLDKRRAQASLLKKMLYHRAVAHVWEEKLFSLKKGDHLYVQLPIGGHSLFLPTVMKKLQQRGVKLIFIIHDLEVLRLGVSKQFSWRQRWRMNYEEKALVQKADFLVVHNATMKQFFIEKWQLSDTKLISLEIFDYLALENSLQHHSLQQPVVIAGNLLRRKSAYLYQLPPTPDFALYGVNYERIKKTENVHYLGSYFAEDLVRVLQGSFGLVWDGESIHDCAGVYGQYLRINNPHKTSLYLAAGLPVLIWKEAALAPFIQREGCGILLQDITEISTLLATLQKEDYERLCQNAQRIGKKLRAGYYLRQVLHKIETL